MRFPRVVLALIAGSVLAAASSPRRELVAATDLDSGLLARPTASGIRVEQTGRSPISILLPDGAQITGLVPLHQGWMVAGTRPQEAGSELLLLQHRGAVQRDLPAPTERSGRWRTSPVAVTVGQRLQTLVWLEGDRRDAMAVRAARWLGDRWSPTETVSPVGRGSQLALAATALADGEVLAVWSAFDGQDDEILWSRTQGGRWSVPDRVAADNAVPDITPTVTTLPGGALVAWSRYTPSGYELVGARFDGTRWLADSPLREPGTLFPSFARSGGDLVLLCRRAGASPGWAALRLDGSGSVSARTSVADPNEERPSLSRTQADAIRFLWNDRSVDGRWSAVLAPR